VAGERSCSDMLYDAQMSRNKINSVQSVFPWSYQQKKSDPGARARALYISAADGSASLVYQ
jgi:hypothetical protein